MPRDLPAPALTKAHALSRRRLRGLCSLTARWHLNLSLVPCQEVASGFPDLVWSRNCPGGSISASAWSGLSSGLTGQWELFDLFDEIGNPLGILPSSMTERIRYKEDSITATLNKLVGANWAFGVRYRCTRSDFHRGVPELDSALNTVQDPAVANQFAQAANTRMISTLHELGFYAIYNHPCGFFARAETNYYRQANANYVNSATLGAPDAMGIAHPIVTTANSGLPGANFWQFNILAGYRFARDRCEVSCGVLNLANQDYHFSVVNPYAELPRERTFVVRCRLNF